MKRINLNFSLSNEIHLDCYQDLKMIVLNNLGCNADLLGACWPWEFQIISKSEDEVSISDVECMKNERFMQCFGVCYEDDIINKNDDIMEHIRKSIDNNVPLIVSFDEFYSFYHFKHIYQNKHGDHAILIFGYDDEKVQVHFYSSIPEYCGVMSYKNLIEGVQSVENIHFISIKKAQEKKLEEELIWCEYIREVISIKEGYYEHQVKEAEKDNYIYTPQIRNILSQLKNYHEDEIIKKLEIFLSGTWLWHIDRKANLSRKAIKLSKLDKYLKRLISDYYDEVIEKWTLASRILYKIMLSRDLKRYVEVENIFKEIQELDMQFFCKLIDSDKLKIIT